MLSYELPPVFPDAMMRLGVHEMADFIAAWCSAHYPPDVFTGESGEPGPVFVVRLRTAATDLVSARFANKWTMTSQTEAM